MRQLQGTGQWAEDFCIYVGGWVGFAIGCVYICVCVCLHVTLCDIDTFFCQYSNTYVTKYSQHLHYLF
jgi:hypothetical protein